LGNRLSDNILEMVQQSDIAVMAH